MRERRIGGLGETRVPLCIPGIEPMMQVVRREEDVQIRVVGSQRQLHHEQRQVNDGRYQEDEAQGNRPSRPCRYGTFQRLPPNSFDSRTIDAVARVESI